MKSKIDYLKTKFHILFIIYPILVVCIGLLIFPLILYVCVLGDTGLIFIIIEFSFIVCFFLLYIYNIKKNEHKSNLILFSVLLAYIAMSITNSATYSYRFAITPLNLSNYALHLIPFLLGIILDKYYKIWSIIWLCLFSIYGVIQYYVYKFRGLLATIHDIPNIKSANDISSMYDINIDIYIVFVVVILALTILLIVFSKLNYYPIKKRIIIEVSGLFISIISILFMNYIYIIRNKNSSTSVSIVSLVGGIPSDGNLIYVYYDAVFNNVKKPDDYNAKEVQEQIDSIKEETYNNEKVTIIAILNESWSDLSLIGDIDTNKDYLSYWRNAENVYKGYVTVAPYGNYTANSEFEFLTDYSMYFMPTNVGVFTNYMDHDINSNVSYLTNLGFNTIAFSNCKSLMWNRGNVYNYLGFTTQNLLDTEENTLWDIPKETDSDFYGKLNTVIDNQDNTKSNFYFLTTTQNHMPFKNYGDQEIEILDENLKDENLTNYLNCVNMSDKAFYELTKHYKNSNEKVIIVMFGDHYPNLPLVYNKLLNKKLADLSIEEQAKMHMTPFIVWSNQSLGEYNNKFNDNISLNYLMNDIFKISNIPLSKIQQIIESYRQEIPIISSYGYKTKDNQYIPLNSQEDSELLKEYNKLQYYELFDNTIEH